MVLATIASGNTDVADVLFLFAVVFAVVGAVVAVVVRIPDFVAAALIALSIAAIGGGLLAL